MVQELSVARMSSMLYQMYGAAHLLELEFGTARIHLRSNEPRLLQKLRAYFQAFFQETPLEAPTMEILAIQSLTHDLDLHVLFHVRPPEPGKTRIKEEFADLPDGRLVRKRATGMLFAFGNGRNVAFGDCLANDNQVVNFVNNRFMELMLNRDCILGHAAAVSTGKRGVAIAGVAGAGKSTLSLKLLERGFSFVSNDRLLVRAGKNGLEMSGVAKHPRVNPGTIIHHPSLRRMLSSEEIEYFENLSETALWTYEQKYDVLVNDVFGPGRVCMVSPLDALVLLHWDRERDAPLQILPANLDLEPEVIECFMKSPGLFYEPSAESMARLTPESYRAHLRRIPVFVLRGGVDFESAADFCSRILQGEA